MTDRITDDFNDDFNNESSGTRFSSRRHRSGAPIPPLWAVIALVILAGGIWAGWSWLRPEKSSVPLPADTSGFPLDTTATEVEEPFFLPALDVSDEAVRGLVGTVGAHPRLASLLVTDDLVRRFVESAVDLSRGSSPLPALETLVPPEAFTVQRSGDRIYVDPRSYHRYDLLAEILASMDAGEAADVYREILPLIREAYAELGMAEQSWEGTLARAIHNVLAVEVPAEPLEVREAVGRYVYADPTVESLTPAEKHFFRMGPANARVVQEKIREISRELALPEVEPIEGERPEGERPEFERL